MRRLARQLDPTRVEPKGVGTLADLKHVARAVAAHRLGTLCETLHISVQNGMRNDAS